MVLLCATIFAAVNFSNSNKTTLTGRNFYGALSNKVIIIDPGHGGFDPGKTGVHGKDEKDLNLAISLFLKKDLEDKGAVVVMTRTEDTGLNDPNGKTTVRQKKRQDLLKRCEFTKRKDANLFVSIHQNALPPSQSQYYGAQTFYNKGSEDGKELAESIQSSLIKGLNNGNKRVAKEVNGIFILKKSLITSVIVECGFISNPNEEQLLNTTDYQKKVAKNISDGIEEYIKK